MPSSQKSYLLAVAVYIGEVQWDQLQTARKMTSLRLNAVMITFASKHLQLVCASSIFTVFFFNHWISQISSELLLVEKNKRIFAEWLNI